MQQNPRCKIGHGLDRFKQAGLTNLSQCCNLLLNDCPIRRRILQNHNLFLSRDQSDPVLWIQPPQVFTESGPSLVDDGNLSYRIKSNEEQHRTVRLPETGDLKPISPVKYLKISNAEV